MFIHWKQNANKILTAEIDGKWDSVRQSTTIKGDNQ